MKRRSVTIAQTCPRLEGGKKEELVASIGYSVDQQVSSWKCTRLDDGVGKCRGGQGIIVFEVGREETCDRAVVARRDCSAIRLHGRVCLIFSSILQSHIPRNQRLRALCT